MGIIHLLAGRPDNADNMFDRILGRPSVHTKIGASGANLIKNSDRPAPPLQGSTPAQLAFATFGRGAVLQARKKPDDAKAQFLASIKAFPTGSWHDETLYRLATITQDQAPSPSKGEVGPAGPGGGAGGGASKSIKPGQASPNSTDASKPAIRNLPTEASAKAGPQSPIRNESSDNPSALTAKRSQANKIIAVKSEALSYWQELISRYSKSPRCEQAFYNAGVLLCEIAEASDAAASGEQGRTTAALFEKKWKDAAFMLGRFTEFYPKSPWAGCAYVREIDIALERMFDLKLAESLADTGSQWIKRWEDAAARPEAKPAYGPWQVPPSTPDEPAIKFVIYDLRLRGIFAAYLGEKYEKAKQLLAATGPLEPKDGRIDAEKLQRVGLFFLQKAIVAQKPIWNTDVLAKAKTDPQRTALKLADLYLKVVRPDKSAAIYERIVDKDPVFAPALPGLELYACIQLARSYSYDRKDHDRAISTLQMLYRPEFAKEPQLAEGLVWLGTLTFNFTQNSQKATPHFAYVAQHFPDSPWAERASFYYCLAAARVNDKNLADAACRQFISRYPQSIWRKRVETLLHNTLNNTTSTKGDHK